MFDLNVFCKFTNFFGFHELFSRFFIFYCAFFSIFALKIMNNGINRYHINNIIIQIVAILTTGNRLYG